MLRRAASTESDQIQRAELLIKDGEVSLNNNDCDDLPMTLLQLGEGKTKSKAGIGFMKARKHLKALLGRKFEGIPSESELETISLISATKKYSAAEPPPVHIAHKFKMSRLHKSETCAVCGKVVSSIFAQGYKCSCEPLWIGIYANLNVCLQIVNFHSTKSVPSTLRNFPAIPRPRLLNHRRLVKSRGI